MYIRGKVHTINAFHCTHLNGLGTNTWTKNWNSVFYPFDIVLIGTGCFELEALKKINWFYFLRNKCINCWRIVLANSRDQFKYLIEMSDTLYWMYTFECDDFAIDAHIELKQYQ